MAWYGIWRQISFEVSTPLYITNKPTNNLLVCLLRFFLFVDCLLLHFFVCWLFVDCLLIVCWLFVDCLLFYLSTSFCCCISCRWQCWQNLSFLDWNPCHWTNYLLKLNKIIIICIIGKLLHIRLMILKLPIYVYKRTITATSINSQIRIMFKRFCKIFLRVHINYYWSITIRKS